MTAFLNRLAARNPVLVVVDDLQYSGQSTIEFVHYLGRHLAGARLLVVVTVRAEHDEQIGAVLAPQCNGVTEPVLKAKPSREVHYGHR